MATYEELRQELIEFAWELEEGGTINMHRKMRMQAIIKLFLTKCVEESPTNAPPEIDGDKSDAEGGVKNCLGEGGCFICGQPYKYNCISYIRPDKCGNPVVNVRHSNCTGFIKEGCMFYMPNPDDEVTLNKEDM